MKPRLRELAGKDERLVGLLAVEVLFALYDSEEPGGQHVLDMCCLFLIKVLAQLDFRNAHVRANLAGALVRLNPGRRNSADGEGRGIDPGQQQLRRLFGLGEDVHQGISNEI